MLVVNEEILIFDYDNLEAEPEDYFHIYDFCESANFFGKPVIALNQGDDPKNFYFWLMFIGKYEDFKM